MKVKSLSRVRLLATPWTAAYQVPPSIGFSRQEDWSGVPLPSPILKVSLQAFEGPFDLLVYLIENAQMDIFDLRISETGNKNGSPL